MEDKKILVTGGAGFIGSHLTRKLIEQGNNVTITVKYKSIIDNVRLSNVWNDVNIVEVDLRNIDSLRQLGNEYFDIIFHLAAYNHVGDSFLHVNESLMSNAIATANLLESGIEYGRFVYTATSEVYGFQEVVPFHENFQPFPISPYAVGKYAGELYARMKRHKDDSPIVVIRPFNTFGPYQSERAVIPELIIKCLKGQPVETTEGKQTREFNFIENIVNGFLSIAEVETIPDQVINIGSKQEIAICDLVKKIHELCDSTSDLRIGALKNRPTEVWRMSADNERALNLLNWKPSISFDEGLEKTISWYKKYLDIFYSTSSSLNLL